MFFHWVQISGWRFIVRHWGHCNADIFSVDRVEENICVGEKLFFATQVSSQVHRSRTRFPYVTLTRLCRSVNGPLKSKVAGDWNAVSGVTRSSHPGVADESGTRAGALNRRVEMRNCPDYRQNPRLWQRYDFDLSHIRFVGWGLWKQSCSG